MSDSRVKKANIKDVARMAGVSIKTVSRFLNNEKYIKAETRKKVEKAIKVLSYRPNIQARGLRGDRSYMIGLFLDDPSGDYIAKVQRGILKACDKVGSHLVVEVLSQRGSDVKVRELLSCVNFDGVILTPPVCDDVVILNALRNAQVPAVRVGAGMPLEDMIQVGIDDYRAAKEMTEFLISQGHKKIGFIKGDPDHGCSHDRERGYIHALQSAGITIKSELIVNGMFTFESGRHATEELLALEDRPTAIFCSNDEMAFGAMGIIQKNGLNIPEDISLTGFDDNEMAKIVLPPLTTICQPVEEMAIRAVNHLMLPNDQNKAADKKSITLEYDLKIRDSHFAVID